MSQQGKVKSQSGFAKLRSTKYFGQYRNKGGFLPSQARNFDKKRIGHVHLSLVDFFMHVLKESLFRCAPIIKKYGSIVAGGRC